MSESPSPQTSPMLSSGVSTPEDQSIYLPGSAEKKRALLMYLFVGIMGSLGTDQPRSVYEQYHLKQALGRRTVCLACLVLSLVLLFLPILRYLPVLVYVVLLVMLGLCIKQVHDGKYARDTKNALSVFAGLGEWICDLFEIKV